MNTEHRAPGPGWYSTVPPGSHAGHGVRSGHHGNRMTKVREERGQARSGKEDGLTRAAGVMSLEIMKHLISFNMLHWT